MQKQTLSQIEHKPLYIIVPAATNICEIRAMGEEAIADMHNRADEVIAELDCQHRVAMSILERQHKAALLAIHVKSKIAPHATLDSWWQSLPLDERVQWFMAWDDHHFHDETEHCGFKRTVFAFMDALPHLHGYVSHDVEVKHEQA